MEHVVNQARKLKKEKGILVDTDPKRGRPFSQEIVEHVQEFYQPDDLSCMSSGMKNSVGVMHQKRLLLVNLNEIYAEYQQKNLLDMIGFSKFCELRPKFVVPMTASGMQNVCVPNTPEHKTINCCHSWRELWGL